jgi:hypothetical protein
MTDDRGSQLCTVLRAGRGQQPAAISLAPSDGDVLIALAQRHHVLRETLDGLRSRTITAPAETVATLHAQVLAEAGAILRQQTELTAIAKDFSAIPMIVLKGMPLSVALYGDPARRGLGDIDLLIDPSRLRDADAVLVAGGFERVMPAILSPARVAHHLRWSKTFIYRAPQSGTLVELHHRLTHVPTLLPIRFDEAWQDRRTVTVGGVPMFVLGEAEEALYLCVHGAHHRWERLRWLIDIADLLKDPASQMRAVVLAHHFSLTAIVLSALWLCHSRLGLVLDPDIAQQASASTAAQRLTKGCRLDNGGRKGALQEFLHAGKGHLYQLSLKPGAAFKIAALATSFIAAADADALGVPDYLLWLLPVLRPIGLYRRRSSAGKHHGLD